MACKALIAHMFSVIIANGYELKEELKKMKAKSLKDVTKASQQINDYATNKLKLDPTELYFAIQMIARFMERDREHFELINSHEAQINLLTIDKVIEQYHNDLIKA